MFVSIIRGTSSHGFLITVECVNSVSPSHLSASIHCSVPMCSIFCYLGCHLVCCHIPFHHFSFGMPRFLFPSTAICNIFHTALIVIPLLHMSKPYQPLLSEEFSHRVHVCLSSDVYIYLMIQSCLSSCPSQHFSCVQFPLHLRRSAVAQW